MNSRALFLMVAVSGCVGVVGEEPTDAAVIVTDAGLVDTDAGVTVTDAGVDVTDGGLLVTDAGVTIPDAGITSPNDAGTAVDAGPGDAPLTPRTVTEFGYQWSDLAVGAGGFIVGMNLQKDGQHVIRTDTFGAYIWAGDRWNQLVNAERVPDADEPDFGQGVVDVVTAPNDLNRLYLFFRGLVFRSDDRGATWARTTFSFIDTNPNDEYRTGSFKLAVDPANKDVVYAAARDRAHDEGVRVTTNGGASWASIPNSAIPAGTPTNAGNAGGGASIFFDPNSGTTGTGANARTNTVYVSVWRKAIYRSTDAGGTWARISQVQGGPPSPTHAWRSDVASDGTLYVVDDEGNGDGWRFRNGVWKKLAPQQYQGTPSARRAGLQSITVDPTNPDRIYVIGGGGDVHRSINAGDSFTELTSPSLRVGGGDIPWLAWTNENYFTMGELRFDPRVPGRLWAAQGIGVWYADVTDTTTRITWHSQSRGIEQLVTNDIVTPPGGPVVVGSWDRALFVKEKNALDAYPAQHLVTDRFNSAWNIDWSGQNPNFLVANTSDHRQCGAYCWGDGDTIQAGYSTDFGRTWTRFFTKPVPLGSTSNPIPSGPASYRAQDVLVNGNPMANPSGYDPYAFWNGDIAVAASDTNNIVWVPTNDVLPAYTTDRGATWTFFDLPNRGAGDSRGLHNQYYLNRKILAADKVLDRTFYLVSSGEKPRLPNGDWGGWSTSAGVWRTTNGGATWTQMFQGLVADFQVFNAKLKAVPERAGHLFFTPGQLSGNPNVPLWRFIDGGQTWTRTTGGVSRVHALGFGKPASAGGYPTLFIYGTVNDVFGVYRSTDNAATWVRIANRPVGRLDSIVTVEGDKDVFGRVYVGFSGSGSAYGVPSP